MNAPAHRRQQLKAIGRELTPEAVAASEALWANAVARRTTSGTSVQRDLAYGEDERHRLDLFMPSTDGTAAARVVFLFVHGGGFTGGNKHRPGSPFYDNIGHWATAQGWVGVNINYRLAPAHGWPSAAQDIAKAIQWLGAHGSAFGMDDPHIILAGHSAGAAHVASYLAHHHRHDGVAQSVRGAVLLSGIYDIPAMASRPSVQAYYGRNDATIENAQSSLDGLAETELPLLLTVAEEDPDGFHAQALTLLQHVQARHRRLPGFCVVPGHNHFTQAFHIGSEDHHLTGLVSAFVESCLVRPPIAGGRP